MKIVINTCFGGFSLSPLGYKRYAELIGKTAYFFSSKAKDGKLDISKHYPTSIDEAKDEFMFTVFSVPNPDEIITRDKEWNEMTMDERTASNELYSSIHIYANDIERNDPNLIKVVVELGDEVNGKCSKLEIIDIPDGVDYVIEEYDGNEHIAEKHRTWR